MKPKLFGHPACRVVTLAFIAAVPMFAQDVINTALTRASTSVLAYTVPLSLIGAAWLGYKYLFNVDVRDHGDWMRVLMGGAILIGANAAAAFFFH